MTRTKTKRLKPAPVEHMDPEAPLLGPELARAIEQLEKVAASAAAKLKSKGLGPVQRAMIHKAAIDRMCAAMSPEIQAVLMASMNTRHVFETDRGPQEKEGEKKEPYSLDLVMRCAAEALLHGFQWFAGHWSIMNDAFFITGEGRLHKILSLDGVTNVTVHPGLPRVEDGQLCVRFAVRWVRYGVAGELMDAEGRPGVTFPITTAKGKTLEQEMGRARSKALKLAQQTIEASGRVHSSRRIDGPRIDDDQAAMLDEVIREHNADDRLICKHYDLRPGERLLVSDLAGCLALVKSGKFTLAGQVAA